MTAGVALSTSAPVRSSPGAHAPRIAVVNGLRGVAILWVVYHHLLRDRITPIFGAPGFIVKRFWVNYHTLFANGWVGVNLFFVLSGLVLYLPYASGARDLTSWKDARAFFVRRARRLFPLYYLSLGVFLLSTPPPDIGTARFFDEVLRLSTFTFTFDRDLFMPALNVALWSLGVEVWFSVLFPLVLLLVRRIGLRWVLVFALVFSALVRFIAIRMWHGGPAYHMVWKDGVFARLDDFVVGMVFAHWVTLRKETPSKARSTLCTIAGVVLIAVGCMLWDNVVVGHVKYKVAAIINDVLLAGIGLVLYGMLSSPPALFRLLLTNRPLQLAGAMCYSLYLWHTVGARIGSESTAQWPLMALIVYVECIFVFSALSYRYIEFPEKSFRALFLDFPRALGGAARAPGPDGATGQSPQIGHKTASPLAPLETVSEKGGPT